MPSFEESFQILSPFLKKGEMYFKKTFCKIVFILLCTVKTHTRTFRTSILKDIILKNSLSSNEVGWKQCYSNSF